MELCTHLKYCRSISPGKAVFFYKTPQSDFVPLRIEVTKINGQKSSYSEGFDAHLQPKNTHHYELAYGNPHTVEVCYVPPDVEEIFCRFSLRVEANSLKPYICSDPDVLNIMLKLALAYQKCGGYKELALRYCMNLLMGTWLWRNRYTQGTQIEIQTSLNTSYSIPDCCCLSWSAPWPENGQKLLELLKDEMAEALSKPNVFWFAEVTARMKTSFCQEIFPSQKFIEKVVGYDVASRQFATAECVNGEHAACISPQKIGAALQRIDDWWSNDAEEPLRVHEYGADHERLTACRHPLSGRDFYHLLARADLMLNELEVQKIKKDLLSGELHYLMAVLIKGGLFQKGRSG